MSNQVRYALFSKLKSRFLLQSSSEVVYCIPTGSIYTMLWNIVFKNFTIIWDSQKSCLRQLLFDEQAWKFSSSKRCLQNIFKKLTKFTKMRTKLTWLIMILIMIDLQNLHLQSLKRINIFYMKLTKLTKFTKMKTKLTCLIMFDHF